MAHDTAYAFTAAWLRDGRAHLTLPLPPSLVRRMLRSAQLAGVRHGFLSPAERAEAWLAPAGGVAAGRESGAGAAVVADAVAVVVRTGARTFARELAADALLPWARRVAATLTADAPGAAADADEPWTLWLLADPGADVVPETLPAFRFGVPLPDLRTTRALRPDLADVSALPVVVDPEAIAATLAWCRADPDVERGGVLLGALALSPAGDAFVAARHFSPAVGADEQPASVRFTREAWAAIHRHRRAVDPAAQVVAWVHSHPRIVLADGAAATAHFLSADDVAIMAGFFDLPHCTAWVVDASDPAAPPDDSIAVYGWDRAGVGLVRRDVDVLADGITEEATPT